MHLWNVLRRTEKEGMISEDLGGVKAISDKMDKE